ncbi:MAG TPA: type IV pilus assembly protein PilM [Gemmatimonadaceae bacterium]|jgi:type IV pilus assembly protein PilM|nr:type IV pilus assembly protein PilM [Gemmatimonadaceae bacterium]
MALFGRKKTTIGLDIGSGLIKVAVVEHGRSEPELTKVAIAPLLADAIVEGEVMDPGIVADAVRAALMNAGIKVKGKGVVTAVGGRDVIIKKIQIDRVKEQQAREIIRWEAEQHVPFDMESVELDFQILDPDAEGLEMSVLLVAAKRELIENKMRLLTDAEVAPGVVDVDAFALHNAFELNYPDAMSGVVCLVNIGHEVTNINILDEGVPLLTRDIAIGTRRFREDLQRERGISAEEADALLQGYDRSPHLQAVTESRGEEIAVGIERAAQFLASSSRSSNRMKAVFTCGGGARVPGLTEALATRLRLPVEQANPLQRLRVRDGAFDSLVIDDVAPLLMLPIGLALRQVA